MADDDTRDDQRDDQDDDAGDRDDTRDDKGGDDRKADHDRALAQEAASWRRKFRDAERERDELKRSQQSEAERAVEDARKEERAKVEAEYRGKLLKSAVRAAAAGRLADPEDAARHLDLDALAELDERDQSAAIKKAVDDLLEAKPYLAGEDTNGGHGRGLVSAGARGTPAAGDRGTGDVADEWLRKRARR